MQLRYLTHLIAEAGDHRWEQGCCGPFLVRAAVLAGSSAAFREAVSPASPSYSATVFR